MQYTIRELIEELEKIENKDQIYLGAIFTAEDFELDGVVPSQKDLTEVMGYRSYDKALGYFGQELMDIVAEQLEEGN